MSEVPDQNDFLDDIERRQDDVLRQLDELNQQIEQTLKVHNLTILAAADRPDRPGAPTC